MSLHRTCAAAPETPARFALALRVVAPLVLGDVDPPSPCCGACSTARVALLRARRRLVLVDAALSFTLRRLVLVDAALSCTLVDAALSFTLRGLVLVDEDPFARRRGAVLHAARVGSVN